MHPPGKAFLPNVKAPHMLKCPSRDTTTCLLQILRKAHHAWLTANDICSEGGGKQLQHAIPNSPALVRFLQPPFPELQGHGPRKLSELNVRRRAGVAVAVAVAVVVVVVVVVVGSSR